MAEFTAKNTVYASNDVVILDHPPDGLLLQLLYDYRGHSLSKFVNIMQ